MSFFLAAFFDEMLIFAIRCAHTELVRMGISFYADWPNA